MLLGWLVTELYRYLAPAAPTTLRCGVTVIPDRRVRKWRQIAESGFHERDVDQFLAGYLRPGDVVLDIGASIGVLTTIAAKSIEPDGIVHSFEVDEQSFAQLEQTIGRNALGNVITRNIALSDKSGEATFVRPVGSWGAFMLASSETVGPRSKRHAIDAYFGGEKEHSYISQTITIDDYVSTASIGRLDLIKLDVDGPELAIIQGGLSTISRFKPAIIVEASMFILDHGVSFEDMFNLLSKLGYWIYAARRDTAIVRRLTSADQAPVDIERERRAIDLFCRVPGREDKRWRQMWFVRDDEK